jgi:dTDP-glucose 4,6-dehydratase
MKVLVTGGAGFIGRWLVKSLLEDGKEVCILDNLSNCSETNIEEFKKHPHLLEFKKGDIRDEKLLQDLFKKYKFSTCYHLAANVVVQNSIDRPRECFDNDIIGTFNLLETAREYKTRFLFMSTCMVYSHATSNSGIAEDHPLKPASPYAGIKISCENLAMSYYYAYKLPVTVVRPFNTYGPMQKTDGEGGVIAIFIKKTLQGQDLSIYGEGTQTRDFIYVEDCANFVKAAGESETTIGEIINAGSGKDITINDLAALIVEDPKRIKHVAHIHPQSEIQKLLASSTKAERLLKWRPKYSLKEGLHKTKQWLQTH